LKLEFKNLLLSNQTVSECLAASCPLELTYTKDLYGCGITGNNHSYNFRIELLNKKPLLIKCTVLASKSFELIEISLKM
jgi:hypothetical protein